MVRCFSLILILLLSGGASLLRAQQVRIDVAPTAAAAASDVTTFAVTPTVSTGFEASLYLRALCPTLPGATFTFTPARLNPPFTTTATLSVALGGARSGGDHVITIEAFNGPLVVQTTCTLTVPDRPAWRVFDNSNSPMTASDIYSIAVAPNGIGWVTTANDLLRFDGTTWTTYDDEVDSMGLNLRSLPLTCDDQGTLWYVFRDAVYSFDGTSRTRYDLPQEYRHVTIHQLVHSPTGALWCFGSRNIMEFHNGTWTDHPVAPLGIRGNVNSGIVTASNTLYVREGHEAVHRYDGTYWTTLDRADWSAAGSNGYLGTISVGRDDAVWLVTSDAAITFNGNQPVVHRVMDGTTAFPGPRPALIHSDRTSTAWVVNSGGLGRYNGTASWFYTTGNSGLPSNTIRVISSDLQGTIWIATDKGLALLDGTAPPIKTFLTSVDGGGDAAVARLSTIAPNPAAGDARASLTLTKPDRVTVQVVNSLGSVVATLVNGYYDAGTVPLTIDTSVLPTGAYVLVATVGAGRSHQAFAVSR